MAEGVGNHPVAGFVPLHAQAKKKRMRPFVHERDTLEVRHVALVVHLVDAPLAAVAPNRPEDLAGRGTGCHHPVMETGEDGEGVVGPGVTGAPAQQPEPSTVVQLDVGDGQITREEARP